MNSRPTKQASAHMARVKSLPCGVCGAAPPSSAHHLNQGEHWTVLPLCYDCHQGPQGIHGDKTLWRIYKAEPLSVLNDTISRLYS